MKTKLELADGFVLKAIESGHKFELSAIVNQAWKYADLMYEEAEKRNIQKAIEDARVSNELMESLTKGLDGNCRHFHTTFNKTECMDCGASLADVGNTDVGDLNGSNSSQLDWQPDWSQAPSNYNWYAMDESREHGFFHLEPQIVPHCKTWFMGDFDTKDFHKLDDFSCTYFGNWQDSLRKRPQDKK